MMPPNLFHYATSELSQDAVLAWLLAWADPACMAEHPELHVLGRAVVAAILKECRMIPPAEISAVRVRRQQASVDLVAVVDPGMIIAIEDKTATEQHDRQLERYAAYLRSHYPDRTIALAYVKLEEQSSLDEVRVAGWTPFMRRDLLRVLEQGEHIQNAILQDFLRHLREVDNDTYSYRSTPPSRWTWRAWQGFFSDLHKVLGGVGWGYVPNQRNGFMGYWWAWEGLDGGYVYLQLENDKLVVKIEAGPQTDPRAFRDQMVRRLQPLLAALGAARPDRLGAGKTVTVGIVGPYIQSVDGLNDAQQTAMYLTRLTAAFRQSVATLRGLGTPVMVIAT